MRSRITPQLFTGRNCSRNRARIKNILCALPNTVEGGASERGFGLASKFPGKSFKQMVAGNLVEMDSDNLSSQRRQVISSRISNAACHSISRGSDMSAEALDADFYRRRQDLCLELAAVVPNSRSLFLRLSSLAQTYAEKAAAAAKSPEPRAPSIPTNSTTGPKGGAKSVK